MRSAHSLGLFVHMLFAGCAGVLLSACGGAEASGGGDSTMKEDAPPAFTIQFAPMVGDKPFSCASTYEGVGITPTTATPMDFRMYVHGFKLIRKGGEKVTLKLRDDDKWQYQGVALLDFEDNTNECKTGSADTNLVVQGDAPAHDDYEGVEFVLGVPTELNHIDAATAVSPLNLPGMWWDWAGGYRWTRIELQTEQNPVYYFHLGAMGCTGTPATGIKCDHNNESSIVIEHFDVKKSKVTVDLAALFKENDLTQQPDMVTDTLAGCMSFAPDAECPSMFKNIGLSFDSEDHTPASQTVFRAQ